MSQPEFQALGDVAERVVVGFVGPSSAHFRSTGVPFLRTGNVGSRKLDLKGLNFVTESFHQSQRKSQLRTGDVVITRVVSTEINCAIVPSELDGANCGNIIVVRPGSRLDSSFLAHLLCCKRSQAILMSRQVGSAQSVVNTSVLKTWEVPVPPMEEQRRIAAILDQADALRAKRREALAQLDSLSQSVFVEMFGDPASNPLGIKKASLGSLTNIATGGTPSRDTQEHFGGNVPWVKTTEVVGEPIYETEEHLTDLGLRAIRGKLHPAGSIVVAMYGQGQTRGRSGLLGIPASCNQACGVIHPSDHFDSVFMFCQLRQAYEQLRALGRGGNQENLNLQILGAFEVLIPTRVQQQIFATRVQAVESLKAVHRAAVAQTDALFASLQHRAFTGQLS